jgi:hypothetical protein
MPILNRQQIFEARDIEKVEVAVPQWGGSVYVKSMDGRERDRFDEFCYTRQDKSNFSGMRALLVRLCVVDEGGQHVFTDEDLPALEQKNAAVVTDVFMRAQALNRLTRADVEKAQGN